jgi:SAM-dependent methyltransferase
MMQGINKNVFFGFMVCRDFSEATTGLFAKDRPLVYIKQGPGERSFSDFRQRHKRQNEGQMFCLCTAADKKEKWEGGHLARYPTWSDQEKDRYKTIQAFYSKGAVDFHKKYGDLLEIEVRKYLDSISGRVLVIGCGSGKEVEYLCNRGCDALGIDFSMEAIHLARKLHPHLWNRFYVEDFYNTINFKEGQFDGIVANAALVHLLKHDDMEDILAQCVERLSPKGKLYLRVIEKTGRQEEYDSYLFGTRRWFVYYGMEELIEIGNRKMFVVIKKERRSHVHYADVYWNSILFEKTTHDTVNAGISAISSM